jgi:hypothetical protein
MSWARAWKASMHFVFPYCHGNDIPDLNTALAVRTSRHAARDPRGRRMPRRRDIVAVCANPLASLTRTFLFVSR